MNEINVVPYIDVMLVLLVIFMVTAPLISAWGSRFTSFGVCLRTHLACAAR